MKNKTIMLAALVFAIAFFSQAQTKNSAHTMKGYLVDKMCGSGMAKKAPDKAMASAAKHTKVCAMEEGCAESGYGLMMNGTWTAFDEKGNSKAAEYLKKTKREDHLFVAVSGTMDGDKIMVKSIKEEKENTKQ